MMPSIPGTACLRKWPPGKRAPKHESFLSVTNTSAFKVSATSQTVLYSEYFLEILVINIRLTAEAYFIVKNAVRFRPCPSSASAS